jgi:hypothetical protein
MPLVFWGGTDAEEEFRKDLTVFYEKYQYKGSYPKARLEDVFDDLRTWCRKSPTARAILEYIDNSSSEVHVVGMSGGFQCFNSTSGRDDRKGTIFIDLDARTEILAKGPHNLFLPKRVRKQLGIHKSGETWVSLNNRVTLLHEIGHSKQWIERPGLFDNDYRSETKVGTREGAPKMKDVSAQEIYAKAKAMQERTASGTGVKPTVTRGPALVVKPSGWTKPNPGGERTPEVRGARAPDLSFLPDVEAGGPPRQKLDAPVGWAVPTEQDNMARHEWPICLEMGLPLRSNYGDIRLGASAPAAQLTTFMKRWADEAAADKARQQAERVGGVRAGAVACPHCKGEQASFQAMRSHERQCTSNPGRMASTKPAAKPIKFAPPPLPPPVTPPK